MTHLRRLPQACACLALLLSSHGGGAVLSAHGRAAQVPDAIQSLRNGADAAVEVQKQALHSSAEALKQESFSELNALVASGESRRNSKLENINLKAEASLRDTKQALDSARRTGAQKARAAVTMQAAIVQTEAESELASLIRRAEQLQSEAQQRTSDAMEASASTEAASLSAQGWRNKWPRSEIQSAIALGAEANATAPHMRDLAANAQRIADLVNGAAVDARAVIAQALEHVKHADVLARTAVDQAAQNSLKLKAIRQLVIDAEKSVATSKIEQAGTAIVQR